MIQTIQGIDGKPSRRQVLVIYDITNTKRRNKLVKVLESYGYRVQKSAFELYVTRRQYEKLISSLKRIVNLDEDDNIKIYKLNSSNEIITIGDCVNASCEDVIVI